MKQNQSYVSVVIPCTDRTTGLKRCLNSALNQSYTGKLEIILVENNSRDRSIVKGLLSDIGNSNIKHHYLEFCDNANVARNYGVSCSAGSIVAFLDSDDEWFENHISSSLDAFKEGGAVYSGFFLDNEFNRKTKASRQIQSNDSPYSFLFGKNSAFAQTSSYVLKKSVLETYLWDETLKRNQDYDFFIRIQKDIGWRFKSSITTTVFWEEGGARTYSFDAFTRFYKKHCELMTPPERAAYIADVMKGLAMFSEIGYCDFQKRIVPYRKYLSFYDSIFTYNFTITHFLLKFKSVIRRVL